MSGNATSSSSGAGLAGSSAHRRLSKRPTYSKFTQQELPACKPILTPKVVVLTFIVVSIIFIPLGVATLLASRSVVEIIYQYETECIPVGFRGTQEDELNFIQSNLSKRCDAMLTIPKDMTQPIYIYYELDNFYQNHRRYVESRSDAQLMDAGNKNSTTGCEPEDIANGSPIVPCGLIAWSMFNDTYNFTINNQQVQVNKQGISWQSDREHKFGSNVYPQNFQNGTLIGGATLLPNVPLSEQEDLIVWMRTAALPNFRKLYGKLEMDLHPTDLIVVTLENNYNTYSFSGTKKVVLSTTSWLGGKNDFLGIAYLTVGGLCFFLAMVFAVVYLVKPRRLGDPSYLSWNNNPGGR